MSDFKNWYASQQQEESQSLPLFSTLQSSASSSLSSLQSSASGMLPQSTPATIFGLSYATRFRLFTCLLLLSAVFLSLALFVGLPALALRPQKFALSFAFGNFAFQGAFSMLVGPIAHVKSMLQPDRLPFTAVYLGSTASTLYFCFSYGGVSGYVMVLASVVLQLLSLLWYLITFIPGGSRGLQVVTKAVSKLLGPLFNALTQCTAMCFSKCMGG